MQISVNKDRLIGLIRVKLAYDRENFSEEMIEDELSFLQYSEPELSEKEKFSLTDSNELLKEILPLGKKFLVAIDYDGCVVLYDNKLFTIDQFKAIEDNDVLPLTVSYVCNEDLFISIPATVTNINQFWDYVSEVIS